MIRIVSTITLLSLASVAFGQDFEPLYRRMLTFKTFAEFDDVDKEILVVCDYLLSQPLTREGMPRNYQYALRSLVRWCSNTESYRILIFGKIIESTREDPLMQNMFMAAMGKYLLEQRYNHNRHVLPVKRPNVNYADLPEVRETLLEGARIFFNYLKNTSGEKPNKALRNGVKAFDNGTLEEYMFKRA